MVNRKEEQGRESIERTKKKAGEDAQIEWLPCDMGNLDQVKEVSGGIRERENRLDLVCLSIHCIPWVSPVSKDSF